MLRRPFVVTAVAGLLSWSVAARAQAGAPEKSPDGGAAPKSPPPAAPADSKKAPATEAPKGGGTATEAAPAKGAETAPPATPAPKTETGESEPTSGSGTQPTPEARPPSEAQPPTREAGPGLGAVGLWPEQTPANATPPGKAPTSEGAHANDDVLAEDWWSHARPVFEIHGYFRTRAELFHNFSLGRVDAPDAATWARPLDDSYQGSNETTYGPNKLCTISEAGGSKDLDNPATNLSPYCTNKSQAGANMRFRLEPELHISDNLRVMSQLDILDNVVLGATPSSYAFRPASGGGYTNYSANPYARQGVFDDTIVPPQSGVNSLASSIAVKRVWAEYVTPVGELRFGRMPDHFGLGMVHNSGDGYDDDYQTTIDRLQFITAIKPLDLYIGGSWDFPNEGLVSQPKTPGGQAYDLAQLDDVNQWSVLLMRKQSPELVKNSLAHDQVVLNGGAYVTLRKQLLAVDDTTATPAAQNVPGATLAAQSTNQFSRRNANIWTPDIWLQLLYKKFRFEIEGAAVLGSLDNADTTEGTTDYSKTAEKIREYGFAAEIEQKLVEDKLRLSFHGGWASGDSEAYSTAAATAGGGNNNLIPQPDQAPIAGHDTVSTFRFNPSYRIDLILNRNLLQRVQGVYYVKPSVEYDFMRKPSGQRLGGGAGVIWTRASEFMQTPGHHSDLGIELDGRLYFQSKDGAQNDRPERMGGFYSMLEYGVLFPLAGLDYLPQEESKNGGVKTSAAQILRLYLGVLF